MNNKLLLAILGLVIIAGCTTKSVDSTVIEDYSSLSELNLSLMVTDNLEVGRTTLFSGEMTRLTLNLINPSELDFSNVKTKVINADDLNPVSSYDSVEVIPSNRSELFEWELTAPTLGVGEVLVLNDISVRVYYDSSSEAAKSILAKEPGDRDYVSTYSSSSKSPIELYFDTSYESFATVENGLKNITVNLVYYNQYTGIIDYYDNTNISDNYMKNLVLQVPKEFIFYDYFDENSAWKKVNFDSMSEDEITALSEELDYDFSAREFYDYYYVEFKSFGSYATDLGYNSLCDLIITKESETSGQKIDNINKIEEELTNQRRVLWMTQGFTKVNVLRFGVSEVSSDTEYQLKAKVSYSYSQDFGGDGFGVIIYGLG